MASNNPVAPRLRFPGFTAAWEEKRLGDIANFNPQTNLLPDSFYYIDLECVINGRLEYSKLIYKDDAPSRAQRLLQKGDILFQLVRPYQKNNYMFFLDGDYVASTGYAQIRFGGDGRFFFQLFHMNRFLIQVLVRCTGTSYPAINSNDLAKIPVLYPHPDEQKKIADFLGAVDSKIDALVRKRDLFVAFKRGAMQRLFARSLRFTADDGTAFPDWEEKQLGDIANCLDNRRKPLNSTQRLEMQGNYPYYGANGQLDSISDYLFDEPLVLLAEDGGNFDEFTTRPIAQNISGKCWVNNHAHVLSARLKIMIHSFLFYSLVHRDIRKYINGTSRAKLNKIEMLSIKIECPHLDEQKKIAGFLSALDAKIDALGSQIEQTETFKRGLLQQMFV